MAQYKLFGYQETTFSGQNGEKVSGVNLYLGRQITSFGEGYDVYRQFVLRDRCPVLKLGDMYECNYRRGSGKLESITKI